MLKLDVKHRVAKFVRRLPPKHQRQVSQKILELCRGPMPPDSEHLTGFPYRRASIGEYRIIYRVEEETLRIPLIHKRNDDEVYKRLKRMGG
ncbi:MAG TPA: type II toxin-antitoxin system RelE/ParE family toxin [Candidatus Paceibacterota bacterium]|nr:type II toxin-antitoxin system RelE/ParE family toxin [Candidatus Paceibacterota bacterium]